MIHRSRACRKTPNGCRVVPRPRKVRDFILRVAGVCELRPRRFVERSFVLRIELHAAFAQRRKTLWNSIRSDPTLGTDEQIAAALEKGLTPDHEYRDAVLDIKAGDGTVWRPTDMEGTSGRMVPSSVGLPNCLL